MWKREQLQQVLGARLCRPYQGIGSLNFELCGLHNLASSYKGMSRAKDVCLWLSKLHAHVESCCACACGAIEQVETVRTVLPLGCMLFLMGNVPSKVHASRLQVAFQTAMLLLVFVPDWWLMAILFALALQAKECMLFAGTAVANGAGTGVVTSIAMDTEIGKIQSQITEASKEEEDTPLKQKLDEFGELLAKVGSLTCG